MKLYEIAKDYKELSEMDDHEAVAETLELIEGEFKDKAENCLSVIANWNGNLKLIDDEIKRLQAMKRAQSNKIESLKDYLRSNMEATGISKIESDLFSVSISKGAPVVSIDDESLVPDELVSVATSISPDKKAILKALKDGNAVPGASLVDGKSRIRLG